MSGDCSSSRASIDRPDSASGYAMAGLCPLTVALACTAGLATVSPRIGNARMELDSALDVLERAVVLGLQPWA